MKPPRFTIVGRGAACCAAGIPAAAGSARRFPRLIQIGTAIITEAQYGHRQQLGLVPLNAAVGETHLAVRPAAPAPATGRLSRGKRGPYTDRGVRSLLATLGRRAGVADVHPHRFRHDTARRLVESVDLPTVAALLGHSRLDTVRLYSQPDAAALERAVAALELR